MGEIWFVLVRVMVLLLFDEREREIIFGADFAFIRKKLRALCDGHYVLSLRKN